MSEKENWLEREFRSIGESSSTDKHRLCCRMLILSATVSLTLSLPARNHQMEASSNSQFLLGLWALSTQLTVSLAVCARSTTWTLSLSGWGEVKAAFQFPKLRVIFWTQVAIESEHLWIACRVSNNALGAGGRAGTNGEEHSFSGAFSLADDTGANDDGTVWGRGARGLPRQGGAGRQAAWGQPGWGDSSPSGGLCRARRTHRWVAAMPERGRCIGWKEPGGRFVMTRFAECKFYNPINALSPSKPAIARRSDRIYRHGR